MATPSSSATSASPPLAFQLSQATAIPSTNINPKSADAIEKESRKKAVQKFLARAEVSMVTRALRARLSYASYKATHNVAQVPLRDLEAQPTSSTPHTHAGAKRKASTNNYYNNPATQGTIRRGAGAMAPPTASSSSRYYPNAAAASPGAGANHRSGGPSSNAAQSLFSSILAPPPTKQARTIHNPTDPPVAAPSRQTVKPKQGRGATSKASEARNKKGKDKKGKQKERITPQSVLADAEIDMKAAATLTSLLLQSRTGSATNTTGSPRSSVSDVGGDAGSVHSFSHFAQSSARTTNTGLSGTTAPPPSAESSFRAATPPPNSQPGSGHTTPKASGAAAPTDTEAADLMLYLATSPSPARPNSGRDKDSKDMEAYRTLGGSGGLRAKGRVLFPGGDLGDGGGAGGGLGGSALKRSGEGSFVSSVSSIGSISGSDVGIGGGRSLLSTQENDIQHQDEMGAAGTSESSTSALTPSHLLPPLPSSPSMVKRSSNLNPSTSQSQRLSATSTSSNTWPSASTTNASGKSTPTTQPQAPPTPSNIPFNFNDFINVSPSPAQSSHMPPHRERSSLRADIGRKLFEEDTAVGLGAGIDLVQS